MEAGRPRRASPLDPEATVKRLPKQAIPLLLALLLAFAAVLARGGARPPPDKIMRRVTPAGSLPSSADSPAVTGGDTPRRNAGAPAGRTLRGMVRPHAVDAWTLRFAAGRPATIQVLGEDGASLACVVQDPAGLLLDMDEDEEAAGLCHLRWVPERIGGYRILIRNSGSAPTTYQLIAR